nr:hypothetical protein [Tanacetum cinerariifolium]
MWAICESNIALGLFLAQLVFYGLLLNSMERPILYVYLTMKDTIAPFKLHFGGVLVRGLATQYIDYDYVSMDKESRMFLVIHYGVEEFRTGVVELNVEHSEECLRTNNKLVDYNYMAEISFDQSTRSRQNADGNVKSEQDETTSTEEDDHEEDVEAELDTIIKTLCSNQDTEVIDVVREHYKALNRNKLIPTANILEKELHLSNKENENFKGSAENYLDNFDVESLDEEILDDGTSQMIRMLVRFHRYNENCRTLVRVKCIDEYCKWFVYAADEEHNGKKYFLVKTLNETHTCSKVFTISHTKALGIAEQWETIIYAHPNIQPTYIQDSIKAQLELKVTKSQCKRAKAVVIKRLEKDVLHEYRKLNDYARALVDTNPRSSVDIEVEQIGQGVPPFFKRMYVYLAAVRNGFLRGCRKYLGLEGCFIKGVVKGMLMIAV